MDQRSIRTKDKIRKKLLELLKTDNIESISITDICKDIGINRKTFYRYYKSANDILEELFNELIVDISKIRIEILVGSIGSLEGFFAYLNEFISRNLEYYQLLAQSKQYIIFINRIEQTFADKLTEIPTSSITFFASLDKITAYFLVSGIASLYARFIQEPQKYPLEYVSSTCVKICAKILNIER